jgi:DNA-binding PadR family transcriptional regulator
MRDGCSTIDYDIVLYTKDLTSVNPKDENWNKGIIKFIIIILMNSGPVYGNQISNEIYEKTNGMWKPSPGSIYPALNKLVSEGYAESHKEDGKVVYEISEMGRRFVKEISEKRMKNFPIYTLMGKMWMQILNPESRGKLMLFSAQNLSSSLESQIKEYESEFKDRGELEVLLMNIEMELEKGLRVIRQERKKFLDGSGAKKGKSSGKSIKKLEEKEVNESVYND